MNMMRDVELQEKSAELAKEEAIKGGLDILDKVQELKQILAHAKEANDMVVQCLMVDVNILKSNVPHKWEICTDINLIYTACRRGIWRKGHFNR